MGPFCVSTGDYRPAPGPGHKTSTYWGLSMSYNEAKRFTKLHLNFLSHFLTAIRIIQSNKSLCSCCSAVYQVAFRLLFLTFSDIFAYLHIRPGSLTQPGLTPILGLTNKPGLTPYFGAHKQAGAKLTSKARASPKAGV